MTRYMVVMTFETLRPWREAQDEILRKLNSGKGIWSAHIDSLIRLEAALAEDPDL